MRLFFLLFLSWVLLVGPVAAGVGPADWVMDRPAAGSLPLVADGRAAPIFHDTGDHAVVAIAATDLADDIEAVTGRRPALVEAMPKADTQIWVGTLGRSSAIDRLVAAGRLDVASLHGAWESYLIVPVTDPAPGVRQALVIVGSDRRGTAYGIYELSRAIGVSPWVWWADVPPPKRDALHVADGTHRFGPPSVKYRGIFINDEDWGLHPWAATNFDPERGDIGPKTYEKMFGLLLRLRANLLWPAMHEVTQAFNADPANARLADRYAIIMGSSHAEPMLRNNVGEWTAPSDQFNYATHPDLVKEYWRQRVQANAGYENIYTLGMRGIHDSGIVGADSLKERRALLNRIIADQRAMLKDHVPGSVEQVPQVFTPYKEVLEIYRAGLDLPPDVTLVWPDDNFGYIRQFPSAAERQRPGGSGIYYHLSYLGAPLSHLWLSTVPPGLIELEMGRAYDLGARQLWVANVGDIKPAETNIDLFLTMAWDIDAFRRAGGAPGFLQAWAAREFGADLAPEIADILALHHQLNFERKPEHLQWWLPGEKFRRSDLDIEAAQARLAAFESLSDRVERLLPRLSPASRDAFFQLVEYPVRAAGLANRRFFHGEAYDRLFNSDPVEARRRGKLARAADEQLKALTRRYNEEIADGKWRGMMAEEPADGQWRSYRLTPPILPAPGLSLPAHSPPPPRPRQKPVADTGTIIIQAEDFTTSRAASDAAWTLVPGLGRGKGAMAITPTLDKARAADAADSPRLIYEIDLPPGEWDLSVDFIPTFPLDPDNGLRLGVALDGKAMQVIDIPRQTGDRAWADGVMAGRIRQASGLTISGGAKRRLVLTMVDPLTVPDALILQRR